MKYQTISLPLITLTLAITADAQTMVKEMDNAHTRFIPGAFMKNGKAAIYFSDDDEYSSRHGYNGYEAQIFDFDLNPLKSFNFQILHPYTVTEKRESTGSVVKTKVIKEERMQLSDIVPPISDTNELPSTADMESRKSHFINWFYEHNKYLDSTLSIESLTSNCYIDGTTIYISLQIQPEGYYEYSEYLTKIETYIDSSDMWGFIYTYSTQVPKYDGEWVRITWYDVPVSTLCTPRCIDVANMNVGVYLPFSQTFFNEDSKFEYVRYIAEVREDDGAVGGDIINTSNPDAAEYLFGITASDRDGDGEEDFRQKHYGVHYTGLEIVSEDNNTIYSFPIPDNCEGDASIEFFKSDNSILAQAEFSWYNENNEYLKTTRFYRMDKSSGVANVIRDENRISASPNPAVHGTPVVITVPNGSTGSRAISVTSLNGTHIYSRTINPDVDRVSIPTQGFTPGMYIFTLTENGRNVESCKIIIR